MIDYFAMTTNRIHIDKDFYINILGDKIVFGGEFLPNGYHLTFHFGPKSKHFDLHLTKNNIHYPVFIISHENAVYLFEMLKNNIENRTLFSTFKVVQNIHDYKDYKITVINDDFLNAEDRSAQIIKDLKSNPDSKRLKINKESKLLAETIEKHSNDNDFKNISFQELLKINSGIALISDPNENKIICKFKELPNIFLEFNLETINKWYLFKSVFGFQLWYFILHGVNRGIKILNSENATEIIGQMEKPLLVPVKT